MVDATSALVQLALKGIMTIRSETMSNESQFVECSLCKAKSGTPLLCESCLQNRTTIEELRQKSCSECKKLDRELQQARKDLEGARNHFHLANDEIGNRLKEAKEIIRGLSKLL